MTFKIMNLRKILHPLLIWESHLCNRNTQRDNQGWKVIDKYSHAMMLLDFWNCHESK